jgi:hypothetical protein
MTSKPDDRTIEEAYLYLLGRALVVRQERMDLKEPSFAYNAIKCNPLGSANFVNPNFDVAYLEAWVAVDAQHPVMLQVPKIEHRYYTAQILDEWGEVIVNINERTFPSKPFGLFALVEPGSAPKLPPEATRIALHSSKAKLLARIELRGDAGGAIRLQKQFKLTPHGIPGISRPPPIRLFDNDALIGAELFDDSELLVAGALDVSPVAAAMQQKVRDVARYVESSAAAREEVDAEIRDHVIAAFRDYVATKAQPYRNHWAGNGEVGNYGANYRMRTAANFGGIWANVPSECVYFSGTRDSDEKPLDGGNGYAMHFAKDKLPAAVVDAYWSVILVGVPDFRVVPNPLQRYNLNNVSPLKYERDGSLKIATGPALPKGVAETNWLPSAAGKPFALTFRTYLPKDIVRRGDWTPPPLERVG